VSFRFHKMQGTGNDFVVVHRSALPPDAGPSLAVAVCDRHLGVGADGMLVIGPPQGDAVGSMTVWNADGSVAEMCGNGLRCVAIRLVEDGLWGSGDTQMLGTGSGDVQATLTQRGVRVSLGRPEPAAPRIVETPHGPVRGLKVRVGNPHFVVFAEDAPDQDLTVWGASIETHAGFPEGTNVERVEVLDDGTLRMRVWERGVGETQACGSGACAAFVAARATGRTKTDEADVRLSGGVLRIRWPGDGDVSLEGPARTVFEGVWPHRGPEMRM
jgi:diaminopimelate epimerase